MNLALFDFDGTITTREMLPDFFHLAIAPRRLALGKVLLAPAGRPVQGQARLAGHLSCSLREMGRRGPSRGQP